MPATVEPCGDTWHVIDQHGRELKRGPEWECWLFASTYDTSERREAWGQS